VHDVGEAAFVRVMHSSILEGRGFNVVPGGVSIAFNLYGLMRAHAGWLANRSPATTNTNTNTSALECATLTPVVKVLQLAQEGPLSTLATSSALLETSQALKEVVSRGSRAVETVLCCPACVWLPTPGAQQRPHGRGARCHCQKDR